VAHDAHQSEVVVALDVSVSDCLDGWPGFCVRRYVATLGLLGRFVPRDAWEAATLTVVGERAEASLYAPEDAERWRGNTICDRGGTFFHPPMSPPKRPDVIALSMSMVVDGSQERRAIKLMRYVARSGLLGKPWESLDGLTQQRRHRAIVDLGTVDDIEWATRGCPRVVSDFLACSPERAWGFACEPRYFWGVGTNHAQA